MFSLSRRLGFMFCEAYTQKNHRQDFTANRINQKFIHLHIDYLEMSPKNYDERLAINIYVKSSADKNTKMANRILDYIANNIHLIVNLSSIINVLRQAENQIFPGYNFLPFFKTGLRIISQNNEQTEMNTNKTFKNYQPISIFNFLKYLISSEHSGLLKQGSNQQLFEEAITVLGPWHTTSLITLCLGKNNLEEEMDLLIDHLKRIDKLINMSEIVEINEALKTHPNSKLLAISREWKGTKHVEEYHS